MLAWFEMFTYYCWNDRIVTYHDTWFNGSTTSLGSGFGWRYNASDLTSTVHCYYNTSTWCSGSYEEGQGGFKGCVGVSPLDICYSNWDPVVADVGAAEGSLAVGRRLGQVAVAVGTAALLLAAPVGCTTSVRTHSGPVTPCNSPAVRSRGVIRLARAVQDRARPATSTGQARPFGGSQCASSNAKSARPLVWDELLARLRRASATSTLMVSCELRYRRPGRHRAGRP